MFHISCFAIFVFGGMGRSSDERKALIDLKLLSVDISESNTRLSRTLESQILARILAVLSTIVVDPPSILSVYLSGEKCRPFHFQIHTIAFASGRVPDSISRPVPLRYRLPVIPHP
jgi:hypothetical protein